MAEEVTLVGPYGDSITTDNPEIINNYQYGRGYRVHQPPEQERPARSASRTRESDASVAEGGEKKK